LTASALASPAVPAPKAPAPYAPGPAGIQSDDEDAYRYLAGLQDRGLHDLVVESARAFLKDHPRSTRVDLVRYRLGESLFELGRLSEAREPFEQLAGRRGFERQDESRFRLAQCCLDAGEPRAARTPLERLLSGDAGYLEGPARVLLGEAWLAEGDPAQAEVAYRAVIEGRFGSAEKLDARLGYAWCARERNQPAQALERIDGFLQRAKEDERLPQARLFRAEVLLAANRATEALQAFEQLEATRKTRPLEDQRAIVRGRALSRAQLEQWAAAAQDFDVFAGLEPSAELLAEARLLGGAYRVRAGQPGAALKTLQPLNGAEPELWRARAHLDAGDASAARSAARKGLNARPTAELARELQAELGDACSSLGQIDEALLAYAGADTAYCRHAGAALALGSGRFPEAREFALAAVRLDVEGGEHRRPAAWIAAEAALAQGDSRTASPEFAALFQANERDDVGARALARGSWALWLNDEPQAVRQVSARFLALHAERPEAADQHFLLARAHESLNEVPPALANYEAYLQSGEAEHLPECLLRSARLLEGEASEQRLAQLVQRFPEHPLAPEALYDWAEALSARGAFGPAAQRYDALLSAHPQHALTAAARYGRAYCHLESDEPAACADLLEQVLTGRNATDDANLRLAALELGVWANAQADRAQRAEQFARSLFALELSPERALDAVRVAGDALAAGGQLDAAQKLYSDLAAALTEPAARAEAEAEAAFLALDRQRLDEAEALVRRAQAKAPASEVVTEAAFFIGEARFDAGQGAQAEALYSLAEGNPRLAPAALYKAGFSALRDERPQDAEPRLAKLVQGHAGHELFGEGLYLLGEARFRQDRFAPAIAPLERLAKELPRHASLPKALFRLGQCQARVGQAKAAASTLADLKRRFGDFEWLAEGELERGRALAKLDDRRGARAAFEDVLRRDNGVLAARARLELGRLDERDEQWESALEQFLKVAVLFEGTDEAAQALLDAGGVLERLERFEPAAGRYREILERYPESDAAAVATERLADLGTR
jgi:TolA-binding protein